MNALVTPQQAKADAKALPAVVKPPAARADYLEFLPAHLEILETPASPRASWMLWALCGLLTAALAWSWFAELDIHAIAQGRVQPSGRSKVVQPIDSGRIRTIAVTNGARVRAGDLLLELDSTEPEADRASASVTLEALDGEIARRTAALNAVRQGNEEPSIAFPASVGGDIRAREEGQLTADLGQYIAQRATLRAQLSERLAQRERLTGSVTARERLTTLLNERVTIREQLWRGQNGTRGAVIDAAQVLAEEETNLAGERGQLIESVAATDSLNRRVELLEREFLATQTQRLTDAQRRRDEVRQALVKAESRVERTRLTAPIDGIVQQLSVTTVGQVVTTGQALLVVVPTDTTLEVEALVQNRDIAFLEVGQQAVIKVDSMPFVRYGSVPGVVRRISSDAVDQREAGFSDAAATARSSVGGASSGTARVQNLVFPVTVELGRNSLKVEGQDVALSPGMMVTVEVRTGTRRVIDYLLAPLRETASQAGHER